VLKRTRRTILGGLFAATALHALGTLRDAAGQGVVSGRRRIIVFDVNETLLNVGALAPQFERAFGDRAVLPEWFTNVVLYSQTLTIAGPYTDFGSIARACLDMTAQARGVTLQATDRDGILRGLVSLPAHVDVRSSLERLKAAGFRLVTLTNSAPAAVEQQLTNAGIREFFERALSVDAVRKFKPAGEVYALAAQELSVPPSQLRLIAAHAWDVHGAMRAGYAAAFVARSGKALFPLAQRPDIVAADLNQVASEIIRIDGT
jgi:2-haloacid dehalogenase